MLAEFTAEMHQIRVPQVAKAKKKDARVAAGGLSTLSATSGPARAATRDEDAITQWRTDAWRALLM